MKTITCAECGSEFTVDSTPESDLENKVIHGDQEYNNDVICPACAKTMLISIFGDSPQPIKEMCDT